MALAISTNFAINANTALNAMNKSQSLMGKSISRISTGQRAANPADDPLSYFSGNKIKGDTDGYQALYNGIQDGAARINVADTALSSIIDVLTEMKSKAIAYESLNSTDQAGDAGTAISNAYNQLYSSLSSFTGATYKGASVWDSSGLSFTTTLGGTTAPTTTTYTFDATNSTAYDGTNKPSAATWNGTSGTFTAGSTYEVKDDNGTLKVYKQGETNAQDVSIAWDSSNNKLTVTKGSGNGELATAMNTATSFDIAFTKKSTTSSSSTGGGSGNFTVGNIDDPDVRDAQTISSSGVQGVIDKISKQRTALGGSLAAMDSISSYLSSMVTANDAAYTAVTEANIAKEMTSYVKNNVYSQAAQAMISQANQSLAQVLNLLQ